MRMFPIILLLCAASVWGERSNYTTESWSALNIPVCAWDSCAPVLVRDGRWCEKGLIVRRRDFVDSAITVWGPPPFDTMISYTVVYMEDTIPAPENVNVFQCQHGWRWQWRIDRAYYIPLDKLVAPMGRVAVTHRYDAATRRFEHKGRIDTGDTICILRDWIPSVGPGYWYPDNFIGPIKEEK